MRAPNSENLPTTTRRYGPHNLNDDHDDDYGMTMMIPTTQVYTIILESPIIQNLDHFDEILSPNSGGPPLRCIASDSLSIVDSVE